MKRFLIITTLFLLIQTNSFSQKHSFEIKNGKFLLDKKPVHIYSGEIVLCTYFRTILATTLDILIEESVGRIIMALK